MKTSAIFYHIWTPPEGLGWALLVDSQIKKIIQYGIMSNCQVFCCISGEQAALAESLVKEYKFITIIKSTKENKFETSTISELYNFCLSEKSEHVRYVGYFHTKGVRHFCSNNNMHDLKAINGWRLMLEYGVLERWRDCIFSLADHDISGINFHFWPRPHFQGNFWWARTDYLRKLEAPDSRVFADESFCNPEQLLRVSAEIWVGTGNPRAFSLYSFPFQDKDFPDTFDLYRNDIFPYYLNNSF